MDTHSTDSAASIVVISDGQDTPRPAQRFSPPVPLLISQESGLVGLLILAAFLLLTCCAIPRIPQPQSYHLFADRRSLLEIPNFGDVASNLPFAVIGICGFVFLMRSRRSHKTALFLDQREVWPYLFVFAGLLLTAFGSSYYHLAPDNTRLVWDRLPMTVTFMSMVAAIIAERIHVRLGLWLLPILLFLGLASVLQWYWSETTGSGDLRFYAAVQAYSGLIVLLALFLAPRYTHGSDLGLVLGFYVLAKALEFLDKPIFTALQFVSGHTLKHVSAAAAGYCILRMLQKRTPIMPIAAISA